MFVCVCARASASASARTHRSAYLSARARTALDAAKRRTGTRTFPLQNCANSPGLFTQAYYPEQKHSPMVRTVAKSLSMQAIRASLCTGFPRRLFTSVSYCPAQKPSRSGMEQIHFRIVRMLLAGGKHSINVARIVLAGGERILPSAMHVRTHARANTRTHARARKHAT